MVLWNSKIEGMLKMRCTNWMVPNCWDVVLPWNGHGETVVQVLDVTPMPVFVVEAQATGQGIAQNRQAEGEAEAADEKGGEEVEIGADLLTDAPVQDPVPDPDPVRLRPGGTGEERVLRPEGGRGGPVPDRQDVRDHDRGILANVQDPETGTVILPPDLRTRNGESLNLQILKKNPTKPKTGGMTCPRNETTWKKARNNRAGSGVRIRPSYGFCGLLSLSSFLFSFLLQ